MQMSMREMRALHWFAVLLLGVVAAWRVAESPLDPLVVQLLREKLAAGTVAVASDALEQMRHAPHSRHGLLLYEAAVRAQRRVVVADRTLPELDAERAAVAAELAAARDSTSTSTIKRLEERLATIDRDTGDQSAKRLIESRLRQLCGDGFGQIAALLAPDASDELARGLLVKLAEEHELAAEQLLVELLGATRSALVMPRLMELADEKQTALELRIAALVALGRRGDASATPAAITALAATDWRVKAEAVEALRRFHRQSSIPILIAELAKADGRLRDDLGAALRSLTGQKFAANAPIWKAWWNETAARFVMPSAPAPPAAAPEEGEGGTRFFGIGSYSKHVVFVLDISGSMGSPARSGTDTTTRRTKLEVARGHLKTALGSLPTDARFDIIVYADDVQLAFPTMQPVDDAHRGAALAFIDRLRPQSGTNIYGALMAAFALAERAAAGRRTQSGPLAEADLVDTLFFLTDGQPTAGRVRATALILREIADRNRVLRIRINAVGVGDHDRAFLKQLAADSGGTYAAR